jgi:hypothetical protein
MVPALRRGRVLLSVGAVAIGSIVHAEASGGSGNPLALRVLADSPNVTSNSSAVCPVSGDPLADVKRSVLTTSCPVACSATKLCVFSPSECVSTQRPCPSGSDGCAFQCVPGQATSIMHWRISLFSNASSPDEVRTWGSALPDFALNVSQVGAWVGDEDRLKVLKSIAIVGDDKAPDFPAATSLSSTAGGKDVPRGNVGAFDLPPTFFANHQTLFYLRLQNVKYPIPPPNADKNFNFASLQLL